MGRHRVRIPRNAGLVVVVCGILACSGTDITQAPELTPPTGTRNVLADAPSLVLQAEAGIVKRGEQDDMLRREAELPGFGGFYISADRHVVVYMKPSAKTSDALVRSTLYSAYLNRPEPYVREAMAKASNAEIRVGQYTLSELIAIENAIAHSTVKIPGYVGVGTSVYYNRVIVGLEDSTTLGSAVNTIASLGIPKEAIIPQIWGRAVVTSNWNSTIRPTHDGIQIAVANQTLRPNVSYIASLGYNVLLQTDLAQTHFLTAAHTINSFTGTNGQTGDTIWQPNRSTAPTPIGYIAQNPAWSTSCGTDPATGLPYDYCTDSDVALGGYSPVDLADKEGLRSLGTSDYEGLNGAVGSQHIHGWYAIVFFADVNYLPQVGADTGAIHKSGAATGTTTGGLVLPVMQVSAQLSWGTTGTTKDVLFTNVARVDHMGWGTGDSGGPIFANNPDQVGGPEPYFAVGIVTLGSGTTTNGICTAGTACAVYFTPWLNMVTALNNTMYPSTNYPYT